MSELAFRRGVPSVGDFIGRGLRSDIHFDLQTSTAWILADGVVTRLAQDSGQIFAPAYDFAAQVPGVGIVAGQPVTITLTPVPLGVNGADTGHYVYISGGGGAAEAVLITGGTAVSGATTGTIRFTPAATHTGAWSIGSASNGIQEAIIAAPGGAAVYIPAALYTAQATITVPNKQLEIYGDGIGATRIVRNFIIGDLITYVPQSSGFVNIHGLDLGANVTCISGAQLNLQGSGVGACTYGRVRDLYIHAGGSALLYDGLLADSPNATSFFNLAIRDITHVGLGITSVFTVAIGLYANITVSAQGTASCIRLEGNATHGFAGPVFDNIVTQGGSYGFYADPGAGNVNEGKLSNAILDSHTAFALYLGGGSGGGSTWAFNNLLCSNPTGESLYINSLWNGVLFSNANMGSGATISTPNVRLVGAKNVRFMNCVLAGSGNAGVNNVAVRFEADGAAVCDQINFSACLIGFDQNGLQAINYGTYGMDASAHNHTRISIQNCGIFGNTDPVAFNGVGAGASILLRGNRYANAAGSPTKPVAASTLRGSDWFFANPAAAADTLEACTKDAGGLYAWRTLI